MTEMAFRIVAFGQSDYDKDAIVCADVCVYQASPRSRATKNRNLFESYLKPKGIV